MKRFFYIQFFTVVCIFCLLLVAAFLIQMLFESPSPQTQKDKKQTAPNVVSESVTEISEINSPENTQEITNFLSPPTIPVTEVPKIGTEMTVEESYMKMALTGEVINIIGKAWVSNNLYNRRQLFLKHPVIPSDFLETDYNSRLGVRFNDNSELTLGENSSIKIEKYIFGGNNPENAEMKLTVIKGLFRVITGLIVKINPEKFVIRTRRATIGIRGCHVAVGTSEIEDDIYVLGLTAGREVIVTTGLKGEELMNLSTGEEIGENKVKTKTFIVTQPNTAIICKAGQQPSQTTLSPSDSLKIIDKITSFPSARYELKQKPDGSTVKIIPAQESSQNQEK